MTPEFAQSVVEHMNQDHADAVLAYAQAFGGRPDAHSAHLVAIDETGMDIQVQTDANAPANTERHVIRIDFDTPLDSAEQVRGALIKLARQARQQLS